MSSANIGHLVLGPGLLRQKSMLKYMLFNICKGLSHDILQWRHNERDSVSNHQSHDFLFNCLFRRRSQKTSKLRVTGLCAGNSPVTGEFPAQRASNAENVSIWWRHYDLIGWRLCCQPFISHVWKSVLINVNFKWIFLTILDPGFDVLDKHTHTWLPPVCKHIDPSVHNTTWRSRDQAAHRIHVDSTAHSNCQGRAANTDTIWKGSVIGIKILFVNIEYIH